MGVIIQKDEITRTWLKHEQGAMDKEAVCLDLISTAQASVYVTTTELGKDATRRGLFKAMNQSLCLHGARRI